MDGEGPKIKPELMEPDRIYHCIYRNCALLFFVDEQKFLNCYEIEEPALVDKIRECGRDGIEEALKKYGEAIKEGRASKNHPA